MTKCKKCGGTILQTKCNICELLRVGQTFTGVEVARQNNPNKSRALKVRAKDAAKAEADARAKGVPTRFDREGHPLFESRAHQKAYCRAYGVVNHDGGYGD